MFFKKRNTYLKATNFYTQHEFLALFTYLSSFLEKSNTKIFNYSVEEKKIIKLKHLIFWDDRLLIVFAKSGFNWVKAKKDYPSDVSTVSLIWIDIIIKRHDAIGWTNFDNQLRSRNFN